MHVKSCIRHAGSLPYKKHLCVIMKASDLLSKYAFRSQIKRFSQSWFRPSRFATSQPCHSPPEVSHSHFRATPFFQLSRSFQLAATFDEAVSKCINESIWSQGVLPFNFLSVLACLFFPFLPRPPVLSKKGVKWSPSTVVEVERLLFDHLTTPTHAVQYNQ